MKTKLGLPGLAAVMVIAAGAVAYSCRNIFAVVMLIVAIALIAFFSTLAIIVTDI
jgi:hypothetical protein